MENEERAHLEAHYQRELENMKDDIARLTSLLQQALVFKSREGTSTQPAVITTFVSMPSAPFVFTSQNYRVVNVSDNGAVAVIISLTRSNIPSQSNCNLNLLLNMRLVSLG